jgi:hypothetical protein
MPFDFLIRRSGFLRITPFFLLIPLLLLLASVAMSQEAKPVNVATPSLAEQITQAVMDLDSSKFTRREQAVRDLWQIGLPAVQALESVEVSGNAEARVRAARLLADFRIGILPTTSRQDRELIHRFRNAASNVRASIFPDLLASLPTPWIEELLTFELVPELRQRFLLQLTQDPQHLPRFTSPEVIVELVDGTNAGMPADWKRNTISMLLFSPAVINEMITALKLPSLEKYIADLPPRDRLISVTVFCQNGNTARDLILNEQHDFIFTMLSYCETDTQKSMFTRELFSNPVVTQALALTDVLVPALDELEKRFDGSIAQHVLKSTLQHPGSIGALFNKIGLERLMQLTQRVNDPIARMQCVGHIMTSSVVISRLQADGNLMEILRIANDEPNVELRTIYLKTIIMTEGMSALAQSSSTEVMRGLWDLIVPLQDAELQGRAMIHIVETPAFVLILKDRESAKTILNGIAGTSDETLTKLLASMVNNPRAMAFIADSLLLSDWMAALDRLPDDHRTQLTLATAVMIGRVHKDIDAKISDWTKAAAELPQLDRSLAVASLAVLSMSDDQAEWLVKRIVDETPPEFCGRTLSLLSLSQTPMITRQIYSEKHCHWVVDAMALLAPDELERISSTMVADANLMNVFLDAGQFVSLAKQFSRLEHQKSTIVLSSLFRQCPKQTLADVETVKQLTRLVADAVDFDSMRALSSLMLQNSSVMSVVDANEDVGVFIKVAISQPDRERQMQMIAELTRYQPIHLRLFSDVHLHVLLSIIDAEWSTTELNRFMSNMFSQSVLSKLVQEDKLQSLIEFLSRHPNDPANMKIGHGLLATQLLADYQTRRTLIEQDALLTVYNFAESMDYVSGQLAYRLCADRDVLVTFDNADRLLDLMNAAVGDSKYPIQSTMPISLFRGNELIRVLVESDRVAVIQKFVREQTDTPKRLMLLRSLVESNPYTGLLIQAGQFENLWELIESQSNREFQPFLKSHLVKVASEIGTKISIDQLQSLYQEIDREQALPEQKGAITALMSTSIASPHADLHLDQLLTWIDRAPNGEIHSQWITLLLLNRGASDLISRDRKDLLMTVSHRSVVNVRLIHALFGQEASVDALRKAELFEPLLQQYASAPNSHELLFAVLRSPHATKWLDAEKRIQPWIKDYLADQKLDARPRVLYEISDNEHLLSVTANAGELPTLMQWARERDEKNGRHSSQSELMRLMSQPACLEFLLREKRTDELIEIVRNQPDPRGRSLAFSRLVAHELSLIAIAKGDGLKEMLKLIEELSTDGRGPGLNQAIFNYRVFPYWAGYSDRETLTAFFKNLSQDPPAFDRMVQQLMSYSSEFPNHQSVEVIFEMWSMCSERVSQQLYSQFLSNTRIRWQFVEAGWERDLLYAAKQTRDELRYNEEILFSSTGVVAGRIGRKNFDSAERQLAGYTAHEKGYARLAAFWLQRGVLRSRLTELKNNQPNSPMLPFMLKSDGQFEAAAEAAVRLGDPAQATRILIQGERWQQAAELQQKQLDELPKDEVDPTKRGKLLGRLAIFQHHAGHDELCQQASGELKQIADANPRSPIQRFFINVLLLTDQIEPAIELAQQFDRGLYLTLLGQQAKYDTAFKTVGFTLDDPRGWLDQLMEKHSGEARKIEPVREVIQICELLDQGGHRAQSDTIYQRLYELFPINVERSAHGSISYRTTPEDHELDKALLHSGRIRLLSQRVARRMSERSSPHLYINLTSGADSPIREAFGWWEYLNPELFAPIRQVRTPSERPDEPLVSTDKQIQRLQMLHELLSDEATIEVNGKAKSKKEYIDSDLRSGLASNVTIRQKLAAFSALTRLGEDEAASELFDWIALSVQTEQIISPDALGWIHYTLHRWSDAVEPLKKQWSGNPHALEYRYLSADALLRSGETHTGKQNRQIASLMAVGVDDRFQLITKLDALGAPALATAEANVLFQTAPTNTLLWFDVCERLSETEADHDRIAALIQCRLLRYQTEVDWIVSNSDASMLHKPHLHRAVTAIQAGDFDRAQQHINILLSINRVDPEIAELLVPLLQASDRDAQAKFLSDQLKLEG